MGVQRRDACGAPVHRNTPERDGLIGMEEIELYTGYSEKLLKQFAEERGFPLVQLGGKWVSSKRLVDDWLCNLITAHQIRQGEKNQLEAG